MGGHTLYEFSSPLSLPEVKKEFDDVLEYEEITMETMFDPWEGSTHYSENNVAFDKALDETIRYNKSILEQASVRAQIRGDAPLSPSELSKPALSKLQSDQLTQKAALLVDYVSNGPYVHLSKTFPPIVSVQDMIKQGDYKLASSQIVRVLQAINDGKFPQMPLPVRADLTRLFSRLKDRVDEASVLKDKVISGVVEKNSALKDEMTRLRSSAKPDAAPTLSNDQQSSVSCKK